MPFDEVKVYLGVDAAAGAGAAAGGGEDAEAEAEALRLCRSWVREGRCEKQHHCQYSHALTLAPLGARPSTKSAGSMAPLRVLQVGGCRVVWCGVKSGVIGFVVGGRLPDGR